MFRDQRSSTNRKFEQGKNVQTTPERPAGLERISSSPDSESETRPSSGRKDESERNNSKQFSKTKDKRETDGGRLEGHLKYKPWKRMETEDKKETKSKIQNSNSGHYRRKESSPTRRRHRSRSRSKDKDLASDSRKKQQHQRERIISRASSSKNRHQSDPVPLHLNTKVIQHAEQIQKRKLLWQKGQAQEEDQKKASTWSSLLTATCSDDKSADKFKKLMGIKGGAAAGEATEETSDLGAAEKKQKQEELFRNLDMQYQTARMSTHTYRGVGLGFSSQMMEYAAMAKAPQETQTPTTTES